MPNKSESINALCLDGNKMRYIGFPVPDMAVNYDEADVNMEENVPSPTHNFSQKEEIKQPEETPQYQQPNIGISQAPPKNPALEQHYGDIP